MRRFVLLLAGLASCGSGATVGPLDADDARRLPAKAVVAGRELAVPEATVRMLQEVAHATGVRYRTP